MPFNGSGVFQRVRSWVADAAAGIKIRADYHDAEDDGLAAGLTNCITKDGQSVITQNIPFNNKRITGLADPVNAQDAATKASIPAIVQTITDVTFSNITITGDFTLAHDPTLPMHASTKQYTDAQDAATKTAAVTEATAAAKAAGDIAYQVKDPQLFAGIPMNNQSNYTTVGTDAQKCIVGAGTVTINAALYPIGAVITFVAFAGAMVIANTTTMYWVNPSGGPVPGNRSLADRGIATAVKLHDSSWVIGGNGLT